MFFWHPCNFTVCLCVCLCSQEEDVEAAGGAVDAVLAQTAPGGQLGNAHAAAAEAALGTALRALGPEEVRLRGLAAWRFA